MLFHTYSYVEAQGVGGSPKYKGGRGARRKLSWQTLKENFLSTTF